MPHPQKNPPGRKRSVLAFLRDESGFLSASDYMLLIVLFAIGSLVGLVTVRDAVVQEFGDAAVALENISQTYTVSMTFANGDTNSFGFTDSTTLTDPAGAAPADISFAIVPVPDSQ